jgi:hypothetical protein
MEALDKYDDSEFEEQLIRESNNDDENSRKKKFLLRLIVALHKSGKCLI